MVNFGLCYLMVYFELQFTMCVQQSYTVRNQLNYGKKYLMKKGTKALNVALGHEVRGNSYNWTEGAEYGYMHLTEVKVHS